MREDKEKEVSDRRHYCGYYCNYCRRHNIDIKPFHNFALNDWFERKLK